MDKIFSDLKNKFILVYLDDITIYSKTFEEHLEHLKKVFKRLQNAGLKLGKDKYCFKKQQLAFLGHIISENGIAPDPSKIDKVQNYPAPSNLTELQGFIGLASYYRRFILNFSQIKKSTTAPILQYPDFEKPFILFTDASYQGLGAILDQKDNDNNEHVIAYASRSLNAAEINYSPTEIKCFAAVWGMEYFQPYIYMKPFNLITDHSALRWLLNQPNPAKRVTRWIQRIADYPYTVIHRKERVHSNVNALSWLLKKPS
ncbi:7304_t:CDS:2, partial [Dentiscutata erythropus]